MDTKKLLEKHISKYPEDWEWSNVHYKDYPNMPFSAINPLRWLFHRQKHTGGNGNTPNVSRFKTNFFTNSIDSFKGFHTANYKQVISYSQNKTY